MKKPKIDLVITDLDDTIWDWLKMWYNSFFPYFKRISNTYSIPFELLKQDFKKLHQKYGTSEVSYAYKELETLKDKDISLVEDDREGDSIIHQYYSDKKNNLELFECVHETLLQLKSYGIKLIGFTESNSFYTKYRIKTLSLDGIYDYIYTPKHHGKPVTVDLFYPEGHWESKVTKYNELPKETRKPNPKILLNIIKDMDGKKRNTIYVGDKLDRDIYMANLVDVISIYASYGHNISDDAYDLLREVTHWSDEDVQREIEFNKNLNDVTIAPTYTISKFSEILGLFNFQ